MRYIRLYEEIDFSDIDDINGSVDIGCNVLLFGSSGMNYLGVIDGYGSVSVVGLPSKYVLGIINDIDMDNRLFIDNNNILDLDKIDIRNLISNLVVVGEDISVEELDKNLVDYKCDDEYIIDKLDDMIKEYLNK
jgi:hypothetical protein